jgi:hypothetical protein
MTLVVTQLVKPIAQTMHKMMKRSLQSYSQSKEIGYISLKQIKRKTVKKCPLLLSIGHSLKTKHPTRG